MAKVRVYQLAKELGLENLELMNKIRDMGVEVKSHSSSIEDDLVARIKKESGEEASRVVEKRISGGVIRRRAKKKPDPPPEPEETPPTETEEAEASDDDSVDEAESLSTEETGAISEEADETDDQPEAADDEAAEQEDDDADEGEQPEQPDQEPDEGEGAEKSEADEKAEADKKAKPAVAAKPVLKRRKSQPAARIIEQARIQISPEDVHKPAPSADGPDIPGETEEERAKRKKRGKAVREKKEGVKATRRRVITKKKEFGIAGFEWVGRGAISPTKKKRKVAGRKEGVGPQLTTPKAIKRQIRIDGEIEISELAHRMGVKVRPLLKKLNTEEMQYGENSRIDYEMAAAIATEFDHEIINTAFEEDKIIEAEQDSAEDLEPRPPIVTVMGHVDHGKTSLLDNIRKANVVDGEAGGITQHIGAYSVEIPSGRITFIDTPGHEAFTAMRARGAQVTDIVILIVAADDGVMPQTIEAIDHAQLAGAPIIIAVNKIDKANADPDRVKKQLSDRGLMPEDWGGEAIFCDISALKGEGIDHLLEMITLQAEIMELKANPAKPASGYVVEAKIDKGRGPVATLLVSDGTMKAGDSIVCGSTYGKIRAMISDKGEVMKTAGPSDPLEVIGLQSVPKAGDVFNVVPSEKDAKKIVEHRVGQSDEGPSNRPVLSLEDLFQQIEDGAVKQLDILLKADVQGSVEALAESIAKIKSPAAKLNVIRSAVGGITENDVMLASASDTPTMIIGFNVRPVTGAKKLAEKNKIDIKTYSVIYEIIEDLEKALVGMLDKQFREKEVGRVEVRDTFTIPKVGTIAGSYVTDGKINRSAKVRVLREGIVIYTGTVRSLKRFKDDVREVASGYECGVQIEGYNDIKVGDELEFFVMEEVERTL